MGKTKACCTENELSFSSYQKTCKKCKKVKFIFLIGIHSMQVWTTTKTHGVTIKKTQKD